VTRKRARRLIGRVAAPGLSGLALIFAFGAGPAASAATAATTPNQAVPAKAAPAKAAPSASTASALARAFETGEKVPGSVMGGVRAGTLHTGTANGHEWAIASFAPARSVTSAETEAFQDGAASGLFEKTGGAWHLVRSGSTACGDGVPAALRQAWHIAAPASICSASDTSAATQRSAAQRALAALPATAKNAAATAEKSLVKQDAAKAPASAPAATDPADFGQTIAAIALSQVGNEDTPTVTNFNGVDCDPYSTMVAGFSADSDGCGYDTGYNVENENETWCSDFAKWVWEQTGITSDIDTINAGAVSFYQWATENGQTPEPETGTPQVGDSVLFFDKGAFPDFADHVGIITAVNSDGSINMVNGDFSGGPDISVQYDQDITNLATFAQQAEGDSSEEWVLITPPTTAQAPAPTGQLTGPSVAVAGATGAYHATGTVQGSSVDAYYWTFGDSRTTNASGPDVTHAFSEPGTYTVTVTITSAAGTAVTLRKNVHVLAPSAAVVSAPDDGIWYDPLPVEQYTFTRSGSGLAEDAWNGGSWLQLSVPGTPSATGDITTLAYPDASDADLMSPHAFYRTAGGSLAETYQTTSGWVTQNLPGAPVAGGGIVATNTTSVNANPEVFFVGKSGELGETWLSGGTWQTRTLIGVPVAKASSLTLADTASGPVLFADGPAGTITTESVVGGSVVRGLGVPGLVSASKTAASGSLAAFTTPGGQAGVVYTNSRGALAEATQASPLGKWQVTTLPGSPAANTALAATTYLLPSQIPAAPGDFPNPYGSLTDSNDTEPFGTEAFYMTASGAPAVSYNDGTSWRTATLPSVSGTTGIAGATAFPFEEEPSNLFLSGPDGLSEETTGARSGDPSAGTWTSMTLPTAPSTWANRVILYAADPTDAAAAKAAATAAGLPASSVTTSFSTAWADTLDGGTYLVYAVGTPAVGALYFNSCGWDNPSGLTSGGTPFSYDVGQYNTPPGADTYVNAASSTAAATQALATDDAYYALNGTLPPGVTAAPAAVGPSSACTGSPS
jgi:hypothetical protein